MEEEERGCPRYHWLGSWLVHCCNNLSLCYLGAETGWSSQKPKYQYREHLVGQLTRPWLVLNVSGEKLFLRGKWAIWELKHYVFLRPHMCILGLPHCKKPKLTKQISVQSTNNNKAASFIPFPTNLFPHKFKLVPWKIYSNITLYPKHLETQS